MRSDGGVLYTQIEGLLPQFVQQKHPQFTKFVEKYYEFMELNLLTISNVNLNEDKPFIIAAHSQGALHAQRLINKMVDNTDLKNKLVCAYVIGYIMPEKYYSNPLHLDKYPCDLDLLK